MSNEESISKLRSLHDELTGKEEFTEDDRQLLALTECALMELGGLSEGAPSELEAL